MPLGQTFLSLYSFLFFHRTTHLPNLLVKIRPSPRLGGVPAFLAHLRKMVRAIFNYIGPASLLSNGTIVFTAPLIFECVPTFLPNTPKVIIPILTSNRITPFTDPSLLQFLRSYQLLVAS